MAKQSDEQLYQTLTRTSSLMKEIRPIEGEEYTLESILAEFGKGEAEPAQKKKEITRELPKVGHRKTEVKPETSPIKTEEKAPAEHVSEDRNHLEKHEELKTRKNRSSAKVIEFAPIEPEGDTVAFGKKKEVSGPESDTVQIENVKRVKVKQVKQKKEPEKIETVKTPTEPESKLPPDRVSLKDIMYNTVDSVLSENDDGIIEQHKSAKERFEEVRERLRHPKKKHKIKETEQLWEEEPSIIAEEEIFDEPDVDEVARFERRRCKHLSRSLYLVGIPTVILGVITVLESMDWLPSIWTTNIMMRNCVLGILLAASALFGVDAFKEGFDQSRKHRINSGLGAFLLTIIVLLDCVAGAALGRTDCTPMAAPAAALIWFCLFGMLKEADSRREAYHLMDVGRKPPYTVSRIDAGICRQKGRKEGFIHTMEKHTSSERLQNILNPLFVGIATILAGLISVKTEQTTRILWIWSVLLTVALPLAMPLTSTLPLAWLQHRLTRDGCAIAGYAGAQKFRRPKRIILTDEDLFPKGTVEFNGYKVYSEERSKVISYAASIANEAGSQLAPLFSQQLAAEGGFRTKVDDFHFYEEGGVGATIHGESVLLGSAFFMKKRHVLLPKDVKLQTGVFMAIDGVLVSIFVIKYQPSRNVDWSLRALKRAHIRPILAVRSGNITPSMVRRKFGVDTKAIYPNVSTRIALSDVANTRDNSSDVVLYRGGIMPMVEVALGAKRMLTSSSAARILTDLGTAVGIFFAYYLISVGSYVTLSQFHVLMYGILWLIPTFLLAGLVKHL